jgi:hypothetical protein
MVRELTPSDPIFQHVGSLPGLNLNMGSAGETQDLDYKHDFKRRCSLFSIFRDCVDMIEYRNMQSSLFMRRDSN